MIGFCGLQTLAETPEIEIGWWLARAWWGKGLATEAAREALRDGFERVGLRRVVAIAQPQNRASIRVMEKLGMKFARETSHRGKHAPTFGSPSSGAAGFELAASERLGRCAQILLEVR